MWAMASQTLWFCEGLTVDVQLEPVFIEGFFPITAKLSFYTHYPGSREKKALYIHSFYTTHQLAKEPGGLLDIFFSLLLYFLLSRTFYAQPGLNIEFFPFQQCCVGTIQQSINLFLLLLFFFSVYMCNKCAGCYLLHTIWPKFHFYPPKSRT